MLYPIVWHDPAELKRDAHALTLKVPGNRPDCCLAGEVTGISDVTNLHGASRRSVFNKSCRSLRPRSIRS